MLIFNMEKVIDVVHQVELWGMTETVSPPFLSYSLWQQLIMAFYSIQHIPETCTGFSPKCGLHVLIEICS